MTVVGSGRMRGPMPQLVGMVRAEALKILGVWLSAKLKITTHVDEVLASCVGSLYALRVLRAHGLDEHYLRTVCKATTLNRILYAGPELWGYLTKQIGPGLADSCEDCSRLVSPAR